MLDHCCNTAGCAESSQLRHFNPHRQTRCPSASILKSLDPQLQQNSMYWDSIIVVFACWLDLTNRPDGVRASHSGFHGTTRSWPNVTSRKCRSTLSDTYPTTPPTPVWRYHSIHQANLCGQGLIPTWVWGRNVTPRASRYGCPISALRHLQGLTCFRLPRACPSTPPHKTHYVDLDMRSSCDIS